MSYHKITTVDLENRFDTQTHEVRGALDNLREATTIARNMADELKSRGLTAEGVDMEPYGLAHWHLPTS